MTNDDEEDEEIQKVLERVATTKVDVVQMEIEVILSRIVALNLNRQKDPSLSQYMLNLSLQSFIKNQIQKYQDKNTKHLHARTANWYMEQQITVMRLLAYLKKVE